MPYKNPTKIIVSNYSFLTWAEAETHILRTGDIVTWVNIIWANSNGEDDEFEIDIDLISLRSSSLVMLAKEKLNSIAFDRSITLGMDKAKRDLYQQSAIKFLKNF